MFFWSFAALIQVSLFFKSLSLVSQVSSSFTKWLMPFILPFFLWPSYSSACICFNPRSRVPRCCFFRPFFFRVRSNSHCQSPLHLPLCFYPTWNVGGPHLVLCVSCVSFDSFDPLFLFNFCRVHVVIWVILEGYVAVLMTSCIRSVSFVRVGSRILSNSCIFCQFFVARWFSVVFFFFDFSSCTFFHFERWDGASCVASNESVSRVLVIVSMFQNRTSTWEWWPLENDANAALILFCISVVSCCSNVMVCPRYFAFSLIGKTSTLMWSIVASGCLLDLWLVRIFSGWIFTPHFRCSFRSLPSLFSADPAMWKIKARRQEISSWTGNQFSGHLNWCPCLFRASFSSHLPRSLTHRTIKNSRVPLLPHSSYLEHIALLICRDCGLLVFVWPLQDANVRRFNFESSKGFS